MKSSSDRLRALLICFALIGICFIAYQQLRSNDFVNWDDNEYITENPNVRGGISLQNIKWAFTERNVSYWHPLTWLSHMLDCELFDLKPAGHHLMSLMIHAANSLLLFVLLKKTTGAFWKNAFVAALFAIHPINVDSVAWAAERKNVLSGLFMMLTLLAYVRYCRKPSLSGYLLVALLFVAGLLTKTSLAVLPFAFLLLDYWPLKRIGFDKTGQAAPDKLGIPPGLPRQVRFLIVEKIPLFVLSAASACTSFLMLRQRGITIATEFVPMKLRIANALVSYPKYIGKMFVPRNLAVHYPYPDSIPARQVAAALILLVCITAVALWLFKKKSYLIVGWLWFFGTLLPAGGLVQGGRWPAMADRFAYVPFIGLFIIVAWAVPDALQKFKYRSQTLGLAAAAVLLILLVLTHRQVSLWKDSFTLFSHALEVTGKNAVMQNNLGNVFLDDKDYDHAEMHYRKAIEIDTYDILAHYNLACLLQLKGNLDEAIGHYNLVVQIKPAFADAHNNLAMALKAKGELAAAVEHFKAAIEINPKDPYVYYNLALVLSEQGRDGQAVKALEEALRIKPDFENARQKLKLLLEQKQNSPQ